MKRGAEDLNKLISAFYEEYHELDETLTNIRLAEDKWSLREIVGHLLDSASNNHQRFVRLQLSDNLVFPDYKRDEWLELEKHNDMSFHDLLFLFVYYNKLIGKIISNIDPDCLQNKWSVKWDEDSSYITLEKLVVHYIDHMRGHMVHFSKRLEEIRDL